jgi:hypothetical protein
VRVLFVAVRCVTAARAVFPEREFMFRDGVVCVVAFLDFVTFFVVATRTVLRGATFDVRTCCDVLPWRVDADADDTRDAAITSVVHNVQKTKIIPILFISIKNVSKFQFFRASK